MVKLQQMLDRILKLLQGRSTAAFFLFGIAGNVWHYFHRLDQTWIAFMVALLTFVTGHSLKEDYFAGKKTDAPVAHPEVPMAPPEEK